MLEVLSIYNNSSVLDQMLKQSIEKQSTNVKFTCYDGSCSKIGAAEIYDKLIKKSNAEVIVCCHHDISFDDNTALLEIYNYLIEHTDCIIGAAGVTREQRKNIVYGNVYEGVNRDYRLHHIDAPKEVLSLDECMIAFHRSVYDRVQLDPKTCTGWHFYFADLCYMAREAGIKSFVYPINLWHLSKGKIGSDFYSQLARVKKKYRQTNVTHFVTTCAYENVWMPCCIDRIKRGYAKIKNGRTL